MNVLLVCEALAQKIVDQMDISNPSEVDFAAQPGFDALMDSFDVEPEDITELIRISSQRMP